MEFFRRREEPKKEILTIEEGQFVMPFKDKVGFIPVDLDDADGKEIEPVILEQEIQFKGISGAILIHVDPDPREEKPLTPLGEAHLKTTFKDGKIVFSEAPCYLEIEFDAKNQEQFDLLRKYQAKFYLKDDVYYLDCDGFIDPEFAFCEFRKGENVIVEDSDLKDKNGDEVEVLLPQNILALASIRMRIVEYDDNDDDYEDETTSPSDTPDFIPAN